MTREAGRETELREWLWFVLALGVALRFIGLNWDSGLIFNPDEGNIGRAAAALSFPDRLVSDFSAYNGLALYLPRLLSELLAYFGFGPPSAPSSIVFAGRILSATSASMSLFLIASIARCLWRADVALFAAAVAAFMPGLIQTGHFATTEAVLILCLLILLWLTFAYVRNRLSLGWYGVLVGFVLGIGFGFKTTTLVFAIIPLVAVVQSMLSRRDVLPALGAGAVAALITVVVGLLTTPQIWLTPAAYFNTMRFEGGVVAGTEDVFWTYQFARQIPGLYELAQMPWTMGPLMPVAALIGLALCYFAAWRDKPVASMLLPAGVFSVIYALVIVGWYAKFVRYQTPLLPTLVLFAAFAMASIERTRLRRVLMVSTVLVTAAAGALQLLVYLNPDPRIAGWDWLKPQLSDGDHVVIEPVDVGLTYWGTSTPVTLDMLPLIAPSEPSKIDNIATLLAGGDWMIVASRRHHAVLPRLTGRFPEMCGYYDALWSGRLGYEVVARFTRRPPLPQILQPEIWAEETFTVFDSPELFVLSNTGRMSAVEVATQMAEPSAICGAGGVPTPPR